MATPEITLTVTLQDLTGTDVSNSSLSITLAGYGQALPKIIGTAMIAKTGPMRFKFAGGETIPNIKLWGNDQISPSGTYYAIEVIDDKHNVVQSGVYIFEGGVQSIDLSNATPVTLQPEPPPFALLFGEQPAGAFPGTVYTLSFLPLVTIAPVQLFYNGNLLLPGVHYNIVGKTITLTFETNGPIDETPGDNLYALYIPVSF
jgi:hypothetical protein